MLKRKTDKPIQARPFRIWPGIVLIVLQWVLRFGIVFFMPEAVIFAINGALLSTVAIVLWWIFFSRAAIFERLGIVGLVIVALIATWQLLHESMQLMPFTTYIIPVISLAFVLSAAASRHLPVRSRFVTMAVTILITCSSWLLIRTEGVSGEFQSDFTWRWALTPEEKFLAGTGTEATQAPRVTVTVDTGFIWPGFRGTGRDGILRGVQINTDWSASPPVEVWRRLVGPGWSSFAVRGNHFYTQEQFGEEEIVTCYDIANGQPVWRHSDTARFWEANAGAGPRSTPTLHKGRLYTLGATGIVNVLDTEDGSVIWSRNIATDTNTRIPMWGFVASPLVVGDVVILAAAGSIIAYELTTGAIRWFNSTGGDCYSSPHLAQIDGVEQILLLNEAGANSFNPIDGTVLWQHAWKGNPIVQPAIIGDGDILISTDERTGVRRISVTHGQDGWKVAELWTSARIKPYFNDTVIHKGHAYGFDGNSLACIDIDHGERQWKGGRYGRGQLVLLADQNLLLVLSEKGDLALVEAIPDKFTELADFPAIEGKTWNHPVLAGDILLVRNAQEMAAFQLTLMGR